MNDSLLTLHEAITVGHLDLLEAAHPDADYGDPELDPVATLRNRACQLVGAWAGARQPPDVTIADRALGAGIVAATGALEVAVHGWDVARACGSRGRCRRRWPRSCSAWAGCSSADDDRPTRFDAAGAAVRTGRAERPPGRLPRPPALTQLSAVRTSCASPVIRAMVVACELATTNGAVHGHRRHDCRGPVPPRLPGHRGSRHARAGTGRVAGPDREGQRGRPRQRQRRCWRLRRLRAAAPGPGRPAVAAERLPLHAWSPSPG